ncbi:MAG: CPBP family intramembrane glutamic endopeptidase [Myxococcota bacterium]|nr:CPBP family intramembrane glutamic endopeptidase [Myxococcota bacterium]
MKRLFDYLTPPAESEPDAFGPFEAGLLIVIAIGLTVAHFGGSEMTYISWFGDTLKASVEADHTNTNIFLDASAQNHPYYALFGLIHWVTFCVIGYVLLPCLYLKLCGRKIGAMYLGWTGFSQHLKVYSALYLLVMVPVIIVSFSPSYQAIYPFYQKADRSYFDLVAWELAYGVQFFALEFLFRGVFLAGLRRWAGFGAVFIMLIPYCMLHFLKTGSESLGAIIAGIILGSLAMKYRSIWGGVLLHWLVAISMDVLSLMHQGRLPTKW